MNTVKAFPGRILNFFTAVLMILFCASTGAAQDDFPYRIELRSFSIDGLPGLHSFAHGQYEGKWVLIGGRTDGLHPRQPFNSFPAAHNNTMIYVVDPAARTAWSGSVNTLESPLSDQLQSSNMEFYQDGDHLVLIGGYAYSTSAGGHLTFPYLTVVNLPGLIEDLMEGNPIDSHFKQLQNDYFAVTGGVLGKIGNTFHLVGGHRFDGRYNPMNMPTFTQEYTDAIRRFILDIQPGGIAANGFSEIVDGVHLHRRDYNLLPQIMTDGSFGYTIFSGVFQLNVDLPFLYPVEVTAENYAPVTEFNQYLSNYHSAHVALFDASANAMHNLFFGGISQYFYQDGELVENGDVPFVRTISRVTRDAGGQYAEYQLPVQMPSYLGASAEFIMHPDMPLAGEGIVHLDQLEEDTVLVGYIAGGIFSEAMNPFTFNNTEVTHAFDSVYQVRLVRAEVNTGKLTGAVGYHNFSIQAMPNPQSGIAFRLVVDAPKAGDMDLFLVGPDGDVFVNEQVSGLPAGKNILEIELEKSRKGVIYITAILEGRFVATTSLVIQ